MRTIFNNIFRIQGNICIFVLYLYLLISHTLFLCISVSLSLCHSPSSLFRSPRHERTHTGLLALNQFVILTTRSASLAADMSQDREALDMRARWIKFLFYAVRFSLDVGVCHVSSHRLLF